MKDFFGGAIVAFSMYSNLPVPHVEWTERNMKYAIAYFPLIGIVEGLILYLCYLLSERLALHAGLRAAVLTVLPVAVTGGIHLDGFLDTSDALHSWKDREAKLEIMKDSHSGAFAIICGLCYFVLFFGVCFQAGREDLKVLLFVMVLSRALSALALVRFPKAKNTGLLRTFSDASANRTVSAVMLVMIAVAACLLIAFGGKKGIAALCASIAVYVYYYRMSLNKFGGITGDVAGWFLQVCELAALFASVLSPV